VGMLSVLCMQGYEPSILYIRQSLQRERADRLEEELREERGRGFWGNGWQYEDWLKSKDREEDEKNE
jgi:hypothetical protein